MVPEGPSEISPGRKPGVLIPELPRPGLGAGSAHAITLTRESPAEDDDVVSSWPDSRLPTPDSFPLTRPYLVILPALTNPPFAPQNLVTTRREPAADAS
jgi:hypothetical protein